MTETAQSDSPRGRVLPIVDESTAPFWDAARRDQLVVQRCAQSGHFHWPPRLTCPESSGVAPEWVPVSGNAEVFTFSVVYRSSHEYPKCPYVVAVVQLAEGPLMMTNVVDVAPEDVRVGLPVTVRFEEMGDGLKLPVFTGL
jgi:hypothetical protein